MSDVDELRPARRVEYVPLDRVLPADRNPKGHDLAGIQGSIARFGFVAPSVIDERTGRLVAGNGRMQALREMRDAGQSPPAGVQLGPDGTWLVPLLQGWASRSDAEAAAYLVADNEWTTRGGWNEVELGELLTDLASADPDLLGVAGFQESDLLALLGAGTGDEDDDDDGGGEASDGSLLAVADVSVDEPQHETATGDVWRLGERHHLVVADVMAAWPLWSPLLVDGSLFVPYPGPYAPLALKADDFRLVLVQPDTYMAGHILDKYEAVRGAGSAVKVDM